MTDEIPHGPTGAAAVVAEIGGEFGALTLYTPEELSGAEIEISPGGDGMRTHVAVLERRLPRGTLFAAFYPSLAAGEFTVWNPGGTEAGTVTIRAGMVTEVDVVADGDGDLILTTR